MPDKQSIRVAVVGCGGIAGKHIVGGRERGNVEFVALMDNATGALDKFEAKHFADDHAPAPPRFTDAAKMYQKIKPDAVVINTPHTLHHQQCVEALDAGCHVLVEKPMVTDLANAIDLEKRVEASGKVFTVGYNTPCSIEFHKLREITRNQELGRLKVISAYLSQPWVYFTVGSWRQDPALSGGGQLYDSGAHALNSVVWTVESDVEQVHAFVDCLDAPVDVNGTMNVRFANGVIAAIAINGQSPSSAHASFMFEDGRVDIDPWAGGWINIHQCRGGLNSRQIKYPDMPGRDTTPIGNFVDAILGLDELRTTVRHGIYHSQLMDAVYESARTGLPAKPKSV
ncbi:MAG: hypothetical protein CMJ49_02625 [Planctomycetaceae bacterium]|nr:hypothetical protein [Planctomycetaceae bacterium]